MTCRAYLAEGSGCNFLESSRSPAMSSDQVQSGRLWQTPCLQRQALGQQQACVITFGGAEIRTFVILIYSDADGDSRCSMVFPFVVLATCVPIAYLNKSIMNLSLCLALGHPFFHSFALGQLVGERARASLIATGFPRMERPGMEQMDLDSIDLREKSLQVVRDPSRTFLALLIDSWYSQCISLYLATLCISWYLSVSLGISRCWSWLELWIPALKVPAAWQCLRLRRCGVLPVVCSKCFEMFQDVSRSTLVPPCTLIYTVSPFHIFPQGSNSVNPS